MSRRSRSSSDPFTDLILIFRDLPWWASIVGAVGVYVIFGLLLPSMTASNGIGGLMTAGIMRVLGPCLAVLILISGAVGALYRWLDRKATGRRGSNRTVQR